MSTAKLNVWITPLGKPCEIDNRPDKEQLFVYVLHCDGRVLEWCGRKYVGMQAKCGHLEVEIPVGCYVVGAVQSPNDNQLGNHLTHIAMIRANCGDHVCVTLFNPTLHHCGHWFLEGIKRNLAVGGQPRELTAAMKTAAQAVEGLEKALTTVNPDPFTLAHATALTRATK